MAHGQGDIMADPSPLTPDEIKLVADREFFKIKAAITSKIRAMLESVHDALRQELAGVPLIAPAGFDPDKRQFVKGEHLEDCPYQYLDFPKHFEGDDKFTFRTLFWWGHHVVFALILEGEGLRQHKQNLINRYGQLAGRDLHLGLSPTPWEWKQGQGYTLPLTRDRKSEVAAVLSNRPFFKLARFVPMDDPLILRGRLAQAGQEAFRAMLPVIARDLPR
jgi:hypothetical protein